MGEQATVHQAMSAVMRSIGGVGKDDWNDHQKFRFRGIDALHNAVYGPLCKHGVFVAPEVVEAHYADVQTSQNKPSRQATVRVRYTFYGPAGDSVSVVSQGEAMDSADKATSKAMAMAFKYALLQTFVIPTADQEDADASELERGHVSQPHPQVEGEATHKDEELDALLDQCAEAGYELNRSEVHAYAETSEKHREAALQSLRDRLPQQMAEGGAPAPFDPITDEQMQQLLYVLSQLPEPENEQTRVLQECDCGELGELSAQQASQHVDRLSKRLAEKQEREAQQEAAKETA